MKFEEKLIKFKTMTGEEYQIIVNSIQGFIVDDKNEKIICNNEILILDTSKDEIMKQINGLNEKIFKENQNELLRRINLSEKSMKKIMNSGEEDRLFNL